MGYKKRNPGFENKPTYAASASAATVTTASAEVRAKDCNVKECERALSIQNPIDPDRENFLDEGDLKAATPGKRIGRYQQELRSAKLAPFQGSVENTLPHTGRPSEIKKATKTPEERRKEIEASVAAARLLQEKPDLHPSANGKDRDSHPSNSGTHTASARRKHSDFQKIPPCSEGMSHVRSFWDSMALEKKQGFLQVSVEDLKSHFSSSKDGLMLETLLEALLFAADNKTWRFLVCCCCIEMFTDDDSLVQHLVSKHMSSLSPKLKSVLPPDVRKGTKCSVASETLQQPELKEKVTLSRGSAYLLLDEHAIRGDITCKDGPSPAHRACVYTSLKKENTRSGLELLQQREEKYSRLQHLCEDKFKLLSSEQPINTWKAQLSAGIKEFDTKIYQTVMDMQKLELEIGPLSSYNFQDIILLLVRSFMRAQLEELVATAAKERSEAATEALLAELQLEPKKGTHLGGNCKHNQEKVKDKKKRGDRRKAKSLKVNGGREQQLHKISAEETHFSITSESHPDAEIVGGVSRDELTQQEKEYRHKIELQEEERKLEEILEYQGRIENGGQQKYLVFFLNIYPNSDSPFLSVKSLILYNLRHYLFNAFLDKFLSLIPFWNDTLQARQNSSVVPGQRKLPPETSAESDDLGVLQGEIIYDSINGTWFVNEVCHHNCVLPQTSSSESDGFSVSQGEIIFDGMSRTEVSGTGLKNEAGDYNCFLNVIIQSLWQLKCFREEFLGRKKSLDVRVGDPCAVCALYDIFMALSTASADMQTEAVAPISLRVALSNLYPDSDLFQVMNDASEVLAVIFDCLHRSFASVSSGNGSDCASKACVAHSLFGMNIFEKMCCNSCGLESKHLKYTSFFHNINASALRTAKQILCDSSFGELLYNVQMSQQLACDPESGGCGKLNYIHQFLSNPPRVFTAVLGWQDTHECTNDISATLAALTTEFDFAVLYRGLLPGNKHRLISVACYYGQHYCCFTYNCEQDRWTMYDDETVKVIGEWDDVILMWERAHLQPHILFFEAVY
ncbi:hypothetical protein MKW94_021619 [Papaver nudicaule]|uniref:USP domain-containing protein n=1 Tax=Papaver nudicaule TaxID=74823 RepID=A0AA41SD17_PAPNU|nr:hypothetical protein [Papaver nudicaule]